ncbi:MAG: spore coat associated protein CotJA [Clostridia bacterium]|nr:spore coat associated protein CotJA [Clostridia bacterium]
MIQYYDVPSRHKETPSPLPDELSLAIAYVVFQQNCDMVSSEEGFHRGTIFPELHKPFIGKRGVWR